ncbi:MAG: hypothetical protein JO035_14225 [Betaproteobacteria bacterium]|nr:hypothetical protein [Betaproteobacteria bacterium]
MNAQPQIVSAAAGARWLLDGWRLFRASPLGWIALVITYLLLTNGLALVPFVGVAAALVLVPVLSFGLLAAARAGDSGAPVELSLLFAGLRTSARPQLLLGIVYLASSVAVYGLTSLADTGGLLLELLSGETPEEVDPAELVLPLVVAATAYTPVMMAFWFSPALVGWQSLGVGKSLFFSFFACLLNWRAFLAYGAAAATLLLLVPMAALAAVLLFSGGGVRIQALGVMMPLLCVLLPTLFASFYASYRDIFPPQAPLDTLSAP